MDSYEDIYDHENGKRYHIMATEIEKQNGATGMLFALMDGSGSGGTCIYVGDRMSRVSLAYVAEKMKLGEADAKVVADYINEYHKKEFALVLKSGGPGGLPTVVFHEEGEGK